MAKKKKMKIFKLTVIQELKYEATDVTQAELIALDMGLVPGAKNGVFFIRQTEVKEDTE
jgi:hypothetical protein